MPCVFRSFVRFLLPAVAGLILFGSSAALAAPSYYVYLSSWTQGSGPDPIHLSLEYTLGQSVVRANGSALPGSIAALTEVQSFFSGPFSDGASANAQVQESADDFVISGGPDPWITATFYFRWSAAFALAGGFPGHGSNGSSLNMNFSAGNLSLNGTAYSHNGGYGGTGVLAGIGADGGEGIVALTGSFPVGPHFSVFMGILSSSTTYGNGTYAPAFGRLESGVIGPGPGIGIGNGSVIMDLPPGYTVNSPSFGVINNQFVPSVDVPVSSRALLFESAVPNPSAATTRMAFTLPAESDASLALFDVQGREVRSLARGRLAAGRHEFSWDGCDASGARVPAGVYFAIARAGGVRSVQRLVRSR